MLRSVRIVLLLGAYALFIVLHAMAMLSEARKRDRLGRNYEGPLED